MTRPSNAIFSALLLSLGGAAIMFGWLSRRPIWDYIFPLNTAPVFATGLCFFLAGFAVISTSLPTRFADRLRAAAAYTIVLIGSLQLLENIASLDLWVD
ncbi:MAG: hypothetical protein V4805_13670, partial [Pseudomonadota bacterium]